VQVGTLKADGLVGFAQDPLDLVVVQLGDLEPVFVITELVLRKHLLREVPSQVGDRLVALDSERVDRATLPDVKWHPNELGRDELDLGNRQAYVHESFEGDAEVIAVNFRAPNCTLELTMHQVDDDRLRSLQVGLPRLNARFLIVFTVRLYHRN